MSKTTKYGIGAIAVLCAALVAPVSQADDTVANTDPTSSIRAWYQERGASSEVIDDLVAEYQRGESWDSTGGEVEPVSSETSRIGDYEVNRTTYPDGSMSESKVQVDSSSTDEAAARGVDVCNTSTGGSGYIYRTDCYVYGSNALVEIGFRMDYYTISQGSDKISGVRSPYQYAIQGSATTPALTITRADESAAGPAQARATSQVKTGGSSYTANLTVNVGGDSASTEQDF